MLGIVFVRAKPQRFTNSQILSVQTKILLRTNRFTQRNTRNVPFRHEALDEDIRKDVVDVLLKLGTRVRVNSAILKSRLFLFRFTFIVSFITFVF